MTQKSPWAIRWVFGLGAGLGEEMEEEETWRSEIMSSEIQGLCNPTEKKKLHDGKLGSCIQLEKQADFKQFKHTSEHMHTQGGFRSNADFTAQGTGFCFILGSSSQENVSEARGVFFVTLREFYRD